MKISLPLHSVISFSVINYVVMMRHPRASDEVSFCFIQVRRTYIKQTETDPLTPSQLTLTAPGGISALPGPAFLLHEEVGTVGDDAVELTLRDGSGIVQGPDTSTVAHVMEP